MNLDKLKTSLLEQLPSYSDYVEKNWDYFKQDLEKTGLFLENLVETEAVDQIFTESVKTLGEDIVFLSSAGHEAIAKGDLELAANKLEELSRNLLAFGERFQDWLNLEEIQQIKSIANEFNFVIGWSKGWFLVSRTLTSIDGFDFLERFELFKDLLTGYELIADTVDKYYDSLILDKRAKLKSESLDFFVYSANLMSSFISLEEIVTKQTKNDQILIKLKQTRNTLGFIAWKLSSSTKNTEGPKESEEELEYSKFQARLSEYPDWDREEQIKKNQGAIKLIRSWLAEEISEAERQEREERFERFKQIVDAHRPPGHKLYSEE